MTKKELAKYLYKKALFFDPGGATEFAAGFDWLYDRIVQDLKLEIIIEENRKEWAKEIEEYYEHLVNH